MRKSKLHYSEALQYMLAGKSTITLVGNTSRFTYYIKHKNNNVFYVYAFTGSDNELKSHYTYIGHISHEKYLPKFPQDENSKVLRSIEAFSYTFDRLIKHLPTKVEFWHEGRCGRCGRKLTVPESIKSGFGEECIKRMQSRKTLARRFS